MGDWLSLEIGGNSTPEECKNVNIFTLFEVTFDLYTVYLFGPIIEEVKQNLNRGLEKRAVLQAY